MTTNLPSCFFIQFLEELLKFLVNFSLLKYVESQRSYGFLITKELIFCFQILDFKRSLLSILKSDIPKVSQLHLCSLLHLQGCRRLQSHRILDIKLMTCQRGAEFSSKKQRLLNQGHFVFTSTGRQSEQTFISWTGN